MLTVITFTIWLVWVIIGIIAGYMTGRLINQGTNTVLNVIVAIAGSLLGGWACIKFLGDSENMQILSLVTSLIVSGIFLWVFTSFAPKGKDEE